jgi:alpha-galactosidase
MISRRRFFAAAVLMAGGGGGARRLRGKGASTGSSNRAWNRAHPLTPATLATRPAYAVDVNGARAGGIEIIRTWDGSLGYAQAVNRGATPVRLKEIVLFDVDTELPLDTELYGEGFQMLSQTGGTLGAPLDFSQYTDARHYRLPASEGARACYGLLSLTRPAENTCILAFTSCARFAGRFDVRGSVVRAALETDGLELAAKESWQLEELMCISGPDRTRLMSEVARRIETHHPPLRTVQPPAGWCSWYCFGPRVTARQVLDNLDAIEGSLPSLKYIQIDDGYQSAMGDWLDTGAAFGGDIRSVLDRIRRRGFEPAIWVAPFIAEEGSNLFRQHRDWFITDADGGPLRSDRVTFGGWRRGPWYALDGTHPGAQDHLEAVFRTMRREWGCTYFKLDANFWGAMHGGRFHDAQATRIEAYRRGMQAIRRGAGDAFILGCNHPIWPSIGLVHGSRSSNDIKRSWDRIMTTARQNLSRNWQNGRLWWNDPDAVVLSDLTDAECRFHATAIYASGGMVLSGDDLTALPAPRAAMLKKLLPPTGIAAEFEDQSLRVGTIGLPDARLICLFNWEDRPRRIPFTLPEPVTVVDYWTDEPLGRRQGTITFELAARSARLFRIENQGHARARTTMPPRRTQRTRRKNPDPDRE